MPFEKPGKRCEQRDLGRKMGKQVCHSVCHLFHINMVENKEKRKKKNLDEQNTASGLKRAFVTDILVIFISH